VCERRARPDREARSLKPVRRLQTSDLVASDARYGVEQVAEIIFTDSTRSVCEAFAAPVAPAPAVVPPAVVVSVARDPPAMLELESRRPVISTW
jgi:hypothetical protein